MNAKRMNPLDLAWLMMESDNTPMHVGVLAIFQKPRNAAANYLSLWAQQMRESREFAPPWNYRLSRGRGLSKMPRLVEEPNIELEYHFRHSALPLPGGERELGLMVSRLHSHPLDRHRPLWEFHLIEGLERGRVAFYLKIHHALIEDVNAIPLLLSSLSGSVQKRNMPAPWAQSLPASTANNKQPEEPPGAASAIAAINTALSGLLRSTLKRRADGSFPLLPSTPRSTLNRPINCQRRFATAQFEVKRIESLADASGSTVNEILAYLCGSSLRRFFKEYNALPEEPLVGALPVSLQEQNERLPGNAIAGLRVALGTHIGDPLARLKAIKASMQEVREDRASLPDEAATSYSMLRAAPLYASQLPGVGRFVPPLFNLSVSNTPGPESPQYFNGARLEAIYPLSQLMQFSALSIDCVSYAGTLNIGFTGARDTLPHLQRLAIYTGKAADELERLLNMEGAA